MIFKSTVDVLIPALAFAIPAIIFFLYLASIYQCAQHRQGYLAAGIAGVVLIGAIYGTYKLSWTAAELTTKTKFMANARRNLYLGFYHLQQDMEAGKTGLAQAKINYLVAKWDGVQYFNEDGGKSLNKLTEALMSTPPKEFINQATETEIPESKDNTP